MYKEITESTLTIFYDNMIVIISMQIMYIIRVSHIYISLLSINDLNNHKKDAYESYFSAYLSK